jgi:flagellar biosynthesis/type III secretory pathway protein FliH
MIPENQNNPISEKCQFRAMVSPRRNETVAKNGSSCNSFQPLHKRLVENNPDDGQRTEQDEEAVLAQARQKGWDEGVEKGQKEACRIAKEALAPVLHSFLNNWLSLVQSNERAEAAAAENIVMLSFAIARKILGQEATISPQDTMPLISVLTQNLASTNKLVLHVNSKELEHIQELVKLEKLCCPDHGSVILQPDNNLESGALKIDTDAAADREKGDRPIIHQAMALLAEQSLVPA